MNSNTTNRTHSNRGPGRRSSRGHSSSRGPRKPHHPQAPRPSSGVPALEPIEVDTTPVPFKTLGLD
ncbi:MAG TPA: hypothetical protein VK504_04840, partial [Vicinamibacterales bacterium]|nr:hypothetical protein [Vicinamibacterales bacterium]